MNGPVTPSRSIFISMFNPDVSVECPLVHHPVGKRVLGGMKALPMHCPQIGNKGLFGRQKQAITKGHRGRAGVCVWTRSFQAEVWKMSRKS